MSDEGRLRRVVSHDQLALVADDMGPLDAPAVILLHGGGQTRHSWSGAAKALARRGYRVAVLEAQTAVNLMTAANESTLPLESYNALLGRRVAARSARAPEDARWAGVRFISRQVARRAPGSIARPSTRASSNCACGTVSRPSITRTASS